MIRGIAFFLLVWVVVIFLINVVRHLTRREKWRATKTLFYGFVTALAAFVIVLSIVYLF